jgi:L-glutamine:2-deoxy-scyllo-inosose/3-amino-2,3-dideoxy-scyllo-inosose aminotransferase
MPRLALLGGKPVTRNLVGNGRLPFRADLERKYLIQAYDSGVWDDWPGTKSMAARFEKAWAKFCNSRFAALVTNGTHAIQMALEALDIGAGDEVIVPGLTWQATASAVCDVNAVPVLVDVDDTLTLDPKRVEAAITRRTKAVIPVHLYHRMADMGRILRIARKHELHVIEDSAHSHGSVWKDQGAGTLGTLGAYSFQRSKPMNGGEGGSILMQDEALYWNILSQRACGREYNGVRMHSGNYRMTSFQAAVLLGQLAGMRKRAPLVDRNGRALDDAVSQAPGVRPLRRHKAITRQCGYGFAFLYNPRAFGGLPLADFRAALSAELGQRFLPTYAPLNTGELYTPHLKKRHRISKAYEKAITPSRWDLPNANDLWRNRAVISPWNIYACPPSRARYLTDAIAKIHENRQELLDRS